MFKISLLYLSLLLVTGCSIVPKKVTKVTEKQATSCQQNVIEANVKQHTLSRSKFFHQRYAGEPSRKLLLFFDGTGNDQSSNTNIWKMFKLSVQHACNDNAIVPYYIQGVGTHWFDKVTGGAFGSGIDENIQLGYQFLVEHYQKGDQIFLFGFSRGAYTARALNGMIEFANLLDIKKINPDNVSTEVEKVFEVYNTDNDGTPGFEEGLRNKLSHKFGKKMLAEVAQVSAIGVFDTVPALGVGRDDFPDGYRTSLYAKHGFHALSLDEQRNDFRLHRFENFPLDEDKQLSEVWFAGAHADVGGGYGDNNGLESLSRHWMLESFAPFNLFPKQSAIDCSKPASCELGKLHDEFLDSELFSELGISRRVPAPLDTVHGSVRCRLAAKYLPRPHKTREPSPDYYKSYKLRTPVDDFYKVSKYQCSTENRRYGLESNTNN